MKEKISQIVIREVSLLSGCDDWPIFSVTEVDIQYGETEKEGDLIIPLAKKLEKYVQKPAKTIAGVIVRQLVHNHEMNQYIKEYRVDDQGSIHAILHDNQIQKILYNCITDQKKAERKGKTIGILPFDIKEGEKANIWSSIVFAHFFQKCKEAVGIQSDIQHIFDEQERVRQDYAEMIIVMFLQKQGINIALPSAVQKSSFLQEIEEIVTERVGMKKMKITDSAKMEKVRKKMEKEIIDVIEEKLNQFREQIGVTIEEYRTSDLYDNKEDLGKLLDTLQKNKCLYLKEESLYGATSRFGDAEDRIFATSNGDKTLFFAEIFWIFKLSQSLEGGLILVNEKAYKRIHSMKLMLQTINIDLKIIPGENKNKENYKDKEFAFKQILNLEESNARSTYSECEAVYFRMRNTMNEHKDLIIEGEKAFIIHKEERELMKLVLNFSEVCKKQLQEFDPKTLGDYVKRVSEVSKKICERGAITVGNKVHVSQWMALHAAKKISERTLELCINPYANRN